MTSYASRVRIAWALVLFTLLGLPSLVRAQSNGFLMITEINYHPTDEQDDLEFIELYNASSSGVDLSEWFFSAGVSYQFPQGTWLNAWSYLVVCANKERVEEVYGIRNAIGNWASCDGGSGGCALANEGEAIEISERNGVPAVRIRYNDRKKWGSAADGAGHTLEMVSTFEDQNDADNWAASAALGGSPGEENPATFVSPIVVNEGLYLTAGEAFVELFNIGLAEVDLSGFYVSNERQNLTKSQLGDDVKVAGRSHLVLRSEDVGFDLALIGEEGSARAYFALSQPGEEEGTVRRVMAAHLFEPEIEDMSEARVPDGVLNFSDRAVPTPGEANRVDVEDGIVINEIMYAPVDLDSNHEFLELYNRTDRDIDMTGWRVTSGYNYDFPDGTVLAADSYIVLARDPQYIKDTYGLADAVVFGPDPADDSTLDDFGRLRNDGERINLRDANGNIVDSVRYHDGGEWPDWTDGDGSSIELIDPHQDNDVPSAWDASDDSDKAQVKTHVYEGAFQTGQPEFHVKLNARGMAMVDDMKLVQRTIDFESQRDFIAVGDTWKYFKGTEEPSDPPDAWRQPDFDDAAWLEGATPIGFGEDDEATVLEDMEDNYLTFFCRKEFEVDDLDAFESLVFDMTYDDGFAAYLNGNELIWQNLRTEGDEVQTGHDIRARSSREKVRFILDLEKLKHLFVPGRNVLAVQVHNSSIGSGDARCIPVVSGGRYIVTDGENNLPNGNFEEPLLAGTRLGGWLIQGTHARSGLTQTNPISGKSSLKVVASAKGDNKVNRLEQTLGALGRTTYAVEFKSRWIVGSPTMLTHGHNLASAAFDYPKSHRFDIPKNLGSPGEMNIVTRREIDRTGAANLGPVMTGLDQTPAIPGPNEAVLLRVQVSDPDGIQEVKVHYWIEDRNGRPGIAEMNEAVMQPDAFGMYSALVPGQAQRSRTVFYFEATDKQGNVGRFPVDRTKRSHPLMLDPANPDTRDLGFFVYRHDTIAREDARFPSYKFWMTHAEERHLVTQRRLS
ncbi:MAG: lamin tail domain-containing protein, partial [Planctomycetota bacterium]